MPPVSNQVTNHGVLVWLPMLVLCPCCAYLRLCPWRILPVLMVEFVLVVDAMSPLSVGFVCIVSAKRPAAPLSSSSQVSKKPAKEEDLTIKRKVVPANNSCLFASLDFCVRGTVNQRHTPEIRRIVADKILSDSEKYTEALLGGESICEFIIGQMTYFVVLLTDVF